ncbi:hypothetical protein RN001_001449 [Aquatica leii]|uniref:THAP-type domain-containing protein n=1 Tax=Aquatica leii TaxID=1421715 RepID=A0AAN7SQX2_9COLE|nr:hypothetical protein RN001_001449 [Aquatica leii]
MPVRPCCVPACKNKIAPRYIIPSDKRLCSIWLTRINNPKLFEVDKRKLRNYTVCAVHFAEVCKEGFNEESTVENSFSFPPSDPTPQTPTKLKELLSKMGNVQPSTSQEGASPELKVTTPKKNMSHQRRNLKSLFCLKIH